MSDQKEFEWIKLPEKGMDKVRAGECVGPYNCPCNKKSLCIWNYTPPDPPPPPD